MRYQSIINQTSSESRARACLCAIWCSWFARFRRTWALDLTHPWACTWSNTRRYGPELHVEEERWKSMRKMSWKAN